MLAIGNDATVDTGVHIRHRPGFVFFSENTPEVKFLDHTAVLF